MREGAPYGVERGRVGERWVPTDRAGRQRVELGRVRRRREQDQSSVGLPVKGLELLLPMSVRDRLSKAATDTHCLHERIPARIEASFPLLRVAHIGRVILEV